jgi:short subunit dehydrogenase-like uncharacterized protein
MYLRPVSTDWILYGAGGAAGRFIATHAVALGLDPILAGREHGGVEQLAERLGLRHRHFALDEPALVEQCLTDATLLVNCGPAATTSPALIAACLRSRTHYVDLCSEPRALELALACDEQAKAREILIVPGVGFSVIPSDCLARRLHAILPRGEHLELAIAAELRFTTGAVASTLRMLEQGPLVRRAGRLVRLARPGARTIVFGRRSIPCVTMATVELAAAHAATAIANITVFVRSEETDFDRIAALVRAGLELQAGDAPLESPAWERSCVWARLSSGTGEHVEATLDLPEPLAFTATAVCDFVCRVLDGELPRTSGATTLAGLLGPDFVLELPGVGGFGLRRTLRA